MSRSAVPNRAKSISKEVSLSGVSIHSGKTCSIKFIPSIMPGLFFLYNNKRILAVAENVTKTERGTSLGEIHVVEHVLSAVYGLGIDSLTIELSSPEPPVMDGSSLPFVEALLDAGLKYTGHESALIEIKEPFKVSEKDSSLEAFPFDGFEIKYMINFPIIGEQEFSYSGNYLSEIAPARTFGFLSELEELKKRGLALGASLENALAIGDSGYVNAPRFKDEPVRHKILDLIGDLALTGAELKGKFIAKRSSHALNTRLARIIREQGGA